MKTHFKVWLTRYAMTRGIQEAVAYPYFGSKNVAAVRIPPDGVEFIEWGPHWHITKEAAIAQANKMREVKIASLKKQIAKLEAMRFE